MEVRSRILSSLHDALTMIYVDSGEGVQVGNVGSPFGVLGAWTTAMHDRFDPVGEFHLSVLCSLVWRCS